MLDWREELQPGLKRPELKPKSSKTLQEMKIMRLKNQPLILSATLEAEEAKNHGENAKHSAEEAKVILLKI